MYDYDMVVIGSGPSGRRAAVQFAKLGRSVLVVEKGRRVGGVRVHTGTIPSKTLRETVLNLSGWRELRSRIIMIFCPLGLPVRMPGSLPNSPAVCSGERPRTEEECPM